MNAIAVRRFRDQDIAPGDAFRIAQNRQAPASQISRKNDSTPFPLVANFHFTDGGTQDVAGIDKSKPKVFGQMMPFTVGNGFHAFHHAFDVLVVIQRLDGRMIRTQFLPQKPGIFLLNMRTVQQHNVSDILSCRGAEDLAPKPGLVKTGEIAAVIGMSVRQENAAQVRGTAQELFILMPGFCSMALKQAAIQQDSQRVGFNQMLAACDFTSGPQKRDFHTGLG